MTRLPKIGASFEEFALQEMVRTLRVRPDQCYLRAIHRGAELDHGDHSHRHDRLDSVRDGGHEPRPGGNATGLTTLTATLSGKWLELARERVPGASLAILPVRAAATRLP